MKNSDRTKTVASFTIDADLLKEFKESVPSSKASQVVQQLISNYVCCRKQTMSDFFEIELEKIEVEFLNSINKCKNEIREIVESSKKMLNKIEE